MLLGKLFKLRDKASKSRGLMAEDEEKPFLDHLEDLRVMLMRVSATLFIALVVCLSFTEEIFHILRRPVIQSGIGIPEDKELPNGMRPDDWMEMKRVAKAATELPEGARSKYLDERCGPLPATPPAPAADGTAIAPPAPNLRAHVEAFLIYRASLTFEKIRPSVTEERPPEVRDTEADKKLRITFAESMTAPGSPVRTSLMHMIERHADSKIDNLGPINMKSFGVAEVFNTELKVSLYAAIIIAFPLLLYFVLQFVLPGLKEEEKKLLWPSMAVGFGLFLLGVGFCYFQVAPGVLKFFYTNAKSHGIDSEYRIGDYITFITQFTLIFGLCFELPVITTALVKIGLLNYDLMARTRSYAIIIIVFLAAIITPTTDIFSLGILAVPMVILYEISIWIAWFDKRKKKAQEAKEDEERRAWLAKQAKSPTDYTAANDPHALPEHSANPEPEAAPGREPFGGSGHDDPAHDAAHSHYHDPYHDEHGNYVGDPHHDEHGNYIPDPHTSHDHHAGQGELGTDPHFVAEEVQPDIPSEELNRSEPLPSDLPPPGEEQNPSKDYPIS